MARYLARRLLTTVPVLIGVTLVVFLILHAIPGNPVVLSLGSQATPTTVHLLERRLGLNRPLWVQYGSYLGGLLHGDLGISMQSGLPVQSVLASRFVATLELALSGLVIAIVMGLVLGTIAAARPGGLMDRAIVLLAGVMLGVPQFWLGLLLIIVFAVSLRALPVFGYGGISHLVMPALSIGLVAGAVNVRVVRNAQLEVWSSDYIRTARASGESDLQITVHHVLRNSLIPVITVMGLQLGYLLGGTVIVEQVFGWPGLGSVLISAIEARDYTVVQGGILYLALMFVAANLLVDVLYASINPQVRRQ